jgi:hypothetical protein
MNDARNERKNSRHERLQLGDKEDIEVFIRRRGPYIWIFLLILVLIVPLVLRVTQGAPITPGPESYHELRLADLARDGWWTYDPLRQERIAPRPTTAILLGMIVFGVPWLLPGVLVATISVLAGLLLRREDELTGFLVSVMILLSPAMSVLGTHHTTAALSLSLALLALLLPRASHILLVLAAITDPIVGGFCALLYIVRSVRSWPAAIGYALIASTGIVWQWVWTGYAPSLLWNVQPNIFFEIGSASGISIFLLFMAIYGVFTTRLRPLSIGAFVVLACAVLYPVLLPLATLLLVVPAAGGVRELIEKRWSLDLLRGLVIVLLVCTAMFTAITAAREREFEAPDKSFSQIMTNLRNQERPGAVLTDPVYAPYIEYASGRTAVLGPRTPSDVTEAIFRSRDAAGIYTWLTQQNVAYILVTNDMQERRFSRSDEGLLFLLSNAERFVTVARVDDNRLWYFISLRKAPQ